MNLMEENSKITTDDYIKLMKQYGIEFEGRILPGKWGEYTTMFEEIRRIGSLAPKEFSELFQPDSEYFIDKKIMASELVKEAWNCLEAMDSEYGWRKEVEFRAFKCFESAIICHICLKRRWKPQFEAKPIDPVEAEWLRRRRQRRILCTCTPLQQAGIDLDGQYSRLFTRELDKHVDHVDLPEDLKKRLKRRRPDRVIGLGVTRTLRQYLPPSRTKYCPFRKANVVYPFIVIEAKTAESNGASFGSILRQTAFVIRTCLRLQQNLVEDSGVPHQCIVWSFASMGEEWRLYAAVPNGSKVQIFDLWHGTVLFPEGALQLVLIIEYLCDWACEVYRMSVIKCLTGGGPDFLNNRLSPTGTDTSSLAGDADLRALRAMSLPSRSSLAPELSNTEILELNSNGTLKFTEIEHLVQVDPATFSGGMDAHFWQRWTTTGQDLSPWTRKATIRHSNQVELSSLQVAIPEDIHLLQSCLDSCFPGFSSKDAARKLLVSLQDDNLAVTTSVKATSWQGNQQTELIVQVRALVYFNSSLRVEDWQITRQVLCILCTEKAIEGLAKLAEISPSIPRSPSNNGDDQYEQFLRAINSINLIGGTRSAGLALARRTLSLMAVSDNSGSSIYEWSRSSPQKDGGVTRTDFYGIMSHTLQNQEISVQDQLRRYIRKKLCLFIIPAGSDQAGPPATALEIPNFRTQGVLIKKPKLDRFDTAQDFCFLVISEDIQFDDEPTLGQLLDESNRAKELFAMAPANAGYEQGHRALIERWVLILKGQLPHDTPLE